MQHVQVANGDTQLRLCAKAHIYLLELTGAISTVFLSSPCVQVSKWQLQGL